jgi:hypothetical protein
MRGAWASGRRRGDSCSIAGLIAAILVAGGGCHGRVAHDGDKPPGPGDAGPPTGPGGAGPARGPGDGAAGNSAAGRRDAGAAGGDAPCPADPDRQICEPDGWCWENPLPQGRDVFAVWVPAPREIWGGLEGALLNRNAKGEWSKLVLNPELAITGFWGAGPRDIWAVGRADSLAGVILRWDGTRWTEVNRSAVTLGFSDVDGTSAADVWAVGRGTVMHFDGAAWTAADVGGVVPPGPVGNARVAAAAPDDVWVAMGRRLLRWNGASWTFEDLSVSITDVWADGGSAYRAVSADFSGTAEVQRWNGAGWETSLVVASAGTPELFVVERLAGSGARDVWALDSHGTTYHFDGTAWSTVSTGAPFRALDLWADTPGSAVAVGRQGEIRQFVNGAWRRETEGTPTFISSISGTGGHDIWFGGAVIPPAMPLVPSLLHWDGARIAEVELPATATPLATVWAAGPGVVWVGGQSGFLARRLGATWQTFAVTDNAIQDIWGAAADDAWMSDGSGAVFHWDGQAWSSVTVPLTFVFDFHGTSPDDVWMVGSGGAAHWDGAAWSPVPIVDTLEVSSVRVWATAPDDVWIRTVTVFTTTEIRHFDGSGFDIVPMPSMSPFNELAIDDIWSPGPGQLYVGGDRVLHLDGGSWALFGPPLPHVWGVAGDSLWGAGQGGAIMRHRLPGGACNPGR